jgi:hypothetical protein
MKQRISNRRKPKRKTEVEKLLNGNISAKKR